MSGMWERCVQRPENIMRYVNPRTQHADVPPPLIAHNSLLTTQKFVLLFFYITKDDTIELMVILNSFQDLSAEKDKKRLAVRC